MNLVILYFTGKKETTNEQDEITNFKFDDKGNLIWYY